MLKNSDINFKGMMDKNFPNNSSSAREIVPLLMKTINPSSVIDVGCGVGAWLKAFENNGGVTKILGIDGFWLKNEKIIIGKDKVRYHDLENVENLNVGKFDLAISLEVAEHISQQQADNFVEFLTSISDVVYFSGATPNSGGQHHVNEKWQTYWIKKFKKRGYKVVDYIRPKVWNNKMVCYFYKEESFIFINEKVLCNYPMLLNYVQEPIYDLVHPIHFVDQVVKPSHEWNYLVKIQKRLLSSYKQKIIDEWNSYRKSKY